MVFQYAYSDETRSFGKDMIGWMVLQTESPAVNDRVSKAIDEMFRARLEDADVVLVKLGSAPQPRVERLDQHADVIRQVDRSQILRGHAGARPARAWAAC